MNDASCKKKGVSASPPGNDKCYLLQKGRFFGDEKNNFRFAQGVPLSWNRSHSPTPAPEPSWSDLPGAVHFTALWFRYVKQSEKHLISTLKIAFHVAFSPNVCLKSLIQKKKKLTAVCFGLPLHLSGTEDSLKEVKTNKARDFVSLCPGTQGL